MSNEKRDEGYYRREICNMISEIKEKQVLLFLYGFVKNILEK